MNLDCLILASLDAKFKKIFWLYVVIFGGEIEKLPPGSQIYQGTEVIEIT